MSQLAHVEFAGPGTPAPSPRLSSTLYWQLAGLAAIALIAYWPTIYRLVADWNSPDYGVAYIIPVFAGFVVWRERRRLARLATKPAWSGLLVILSAIALWLVGQLGAEVFLSRCSLVFLVAGIVVLFMGWRVLRAAFFPWAFLFLMIPLPAIVFNHISFPLQLLASRIAADSLQNLPWLGIPVLQEGNVIFLPEKPLEVAQACSGLRSLMSLVAMAIIYGYLTDRRRSVRWLLALAAVPIAVIANSVRIICTGLLVHFGSADLAEGTYHVALGILVYVVALALLFALHSAILRFWPDKTPTGAGETNHAIVGQDVRVPAGSVWRFVVVAALVISTATYLRAHRENEVLPARLEFKTFPLQLGEWSGMDVPINDDELEILGPGDFLKREYESEPARAPIGLFMAYFRSQRIGDTYHSPKNCLPGAGWTRVENRYITLSFPGHDPIPANRFLVSHGADQQVVLYWYWAHNRGVANEFLSRYYLMRDSMTKNRSDGSLIRFNTVLLPGESAEDAEKRLLPFAGSVVGLLDSYVPR